MKCNLTPYGKEVFKVTISIIALFIGTTGFGAIAQVIGLIPIRTDMHMLAYYFVGGIISLLKIGIISLLFFIIYFVLIRIKETMFHCEKEIK